jgi:hypothetical protein
VSLGFWLWTGESAKRVVQSEADMIGGDELKQFVPRASSLLAEVVKQPGGALDRRHGCQSRSAGGRVSGSSVT